MSGNPRARPDAASAATGAALPDAGAPCRVRCLDPADVARAREASAGAPLAAVPYACTLSSGRRAIPLLSSEAAARLATGLPKTTPRSAVLLCALAGGDLCVCDLATLTGQAEAAVLADLEAPAMRAAVVRHNLHGMTYLRLDDDGMRARITDWLLGLGFGTADGAPAPGPDGAGCGAADPGQLRPGAGCAR